MSKSALKRISAILNMPMTREQELAFRLYDAIALVQRDGWDYDKIYNSTVKELIEHGITIADHINAITS